MHTTGKRVWWRSVVSAVLIALLVVMVARNRSQFADSLQIIKDVPLPILLGMGLLFCVTIAFAALTYRLLSFRSIPYRDFYHVEFAAAAVNRLLPAGVGNMGLHGVFLHRQRHSVPETVAILSVNNALGVVTHLILLALVMVFDRTTFQSLGMELPAWLPGAAAAAALLASTFLTIPALRHRARSFMHNFWLSVRRYGGRGGSLAGATVSSFGITSVNVLIFSLAAYAVGIEAGLTQLFLIYTAGVVFGSVTPTPGGLGGVEAGLVAGMVAKGVPATQALAAALTFRLVTYWMPVVLGMLAFASARARRLV